MPRPRAGGCACRLWLSGSSPSRKMPMQPRLNSGRASHVPAHRRYISDHQQFRTQYGNIKVNLKSKQTVGVAQSRGERPYQEDAYTVASVEMPQLALKRNVVTSRLAAGWSNETLEGYPGEEKDKTSDERRRQVAMFGVYDGHGGSSVSAFLPKALPGLLEGSNVADIPQAIDAYRALGGYLKRYRGGPLGRFRLGEDEVERHKALGLDEMCVLAFLQADNAVMADDKFGKAGSVGTVALLHSLDMPTALPYHSSSVISLTIAHLGDTRAILASTSSGRAKALTENHHADSRTEGERLRTSGTGIVTDSFGESRWGGTLANTRGIGDREFKTLGVIGEPEIWKAVLKGPEWAFLVLVSDGISDVMSDQEIVDLVRGTADPTRAANKIVSFAEDVGGEDNMTVVLVPLPGWSKMGGLDSTLSRREYRLKQMQGTSSRQKRM